MAASNMDLSWKDFFLGLWDPWPFLFLSFQHIPQTVSKLVMSGDFLALLSPSAFREALFGSFWATVGPHIKEGSLDIIIPLLEGRVSGAVVHEEVVVPPIHGTVMEVGAGSGMWADIFARIGAGEGAEAVPDPDGGVRRRKQSGSAPGKNITKIYGVEPNPESAIALRKRVDEVGLGDVYEVVPVGIESVDDPNAWAGTIEPGSIDCIVTILCLCSIPEPEKNIKLLYRLLKPGGRWYFREHVKNQDGMLMSLYQRYVNIFWSFFVGSCRICRDTEKSLRNAGAWEQIDISHAPDEPKYKVLPHIVGTLTKQL